MEWMKKDMTHSKGVFLLLPGFMQHWTNNYQEWDLVLGAQINGGVLGVYVCMCAEIKGVGYIYSGYAYIIYLCAYKMWAHVYKVCIYNEYKYAHVYMYSLYKYACTYIVCMPV